MIETKFSGLGVALVTPFDKNGDVDVATLAKLVEYQITAGVDYIVALGTTAETPTLAVDERHLVLKTIVETAKNRVPIVVGIGSNDTRSVIKDLQTYPLEGVSAVLSVVPYYNKPSQEGICQHFKMIAENSPLPIILYNIPSRSGVNMEAKTTLRLAELPNIIGVKEASGIMGQIMQLVKAAPKNFAVLSGDDMLAVPLMAMGGHGIISVVANVLPKEFSTMINFAKQGEIERAKEMHYRMQELFRLMFKEGNPPGIKAAMKLRNLCEENLRLPMIPVSEDLRKEIVLQLQKTTNLL